MNENNGNFPAVERYLEKQAEIKKPPVKSQRAAPYKKTTHPLSRLRSLWQNFVKPFPNFRRDCPDKTEEFSNSIKY